MSKTLKITFLEEAQVGRVAGILVKAFNGSAAKKKKDLAQSLSNAPDKPVTFTAAVNDNVVGVIRCLAYPRVDEKIPGVCLFSLAVDPDFRQQGIGHKLMEHVEGYIGKELMKGQKGYVMLADHTKKQNPQSTFYQKMGYALYGTEDEHKLDEEGMPLMYKYLNLKPARKKKPATKKLSA